MKTFDFYNNHPVGYVDIVPNGNANIDIVGYVDSFNVYHQLSSKESKRPISRLDVDLI